MDESFIPSPGLLKIFFPEIEHALENEMLHFHMTETLNLRLSMHTFKKTRIKIRLSKGYIMELSPTDMIDNSTPTWFMQLGTIDKTSGERREKVIFRANVVVRSADDRDAAPVFTRTLMADEVETIIDQALMFTYAKCDLELEVLQRNSRQP